MQVGYKMWVKSMAPRASSRTVLKFGCKLVEFEANLRLGITLCLHLNLENMPDKTSLNSLAARFAPLFMCLPQTGCFRLCLISLRLIFETSCGVEHHPATVCSRWNSPRQHISKVSSETGRDSPEHKFPAAPGGVARVPI